MKLGDIWILSHKFIYHTRSHWKDWSEELIFLKTWFRKYVNFKIWISYSRFIFRGTKINVTVNNVTVVITDYPEMKEEEKHHAPSISSSTPSPRSPSIADIDWEMHTYHQHNVQCIHYTVLTMYTLYNV